jgi:hypothetical protein
MRLRGPAALSLALYAVGIPCFFLVVLLKHGRSIRLDQRMFVAGKGNSPASNPVFHIRSRYKEIYSLFRPEYFWWRLVIMLRKFCEVAVALMFSSRPLFQAWYAAALCPTALLSAAFSARAFPCRRQPQLCAAHQPATQTRSFAPYPLVCVQSFGGRSVPIVRGAHSVLPICGA